MILALSLWVGAKNVLKHKKRTVQGTFGKDKGSHIFPEVGADEFLKAGRVLQRNKQSLNDLLNLAGNNEPSMQQQQSVHPNEIDKWLVEVKVET